MNLPEYRQSLRNAQERFANAVDKAAEVLREDLVAADAEFFNEPPTVEAAPIKRRPRRDIEDE